MCSIEIVLGIISPQFLAYLIALVKRVIWWMPLPHNGVTGFEGGPAKKVADISIGLKFGPSEKWSLGPMVIFMAFFLGS